MGKHGAKHTGPETPDTLRELAFELDRLARDLRAVADRMDRARIRRVDVLASRGARSAVRDSLVVFAVDAGRKAARAGG